MRKVIILGCGPAGLMAAAAVEKAGQEPIIISKKRKSEMYGAQYLHAAIPGFSPDMGFDIKYMLRGTTDDYRRKVYGDARVQVSPEDLTEDHTGWDIRQTYDNLWFHFQEAIVDTSFTSAGEADAMLRELGAEANVSHFVSTLPAPILCINPAHSFPSQNVWAIGDAPERGIFCPITEAGLNEVVCSGENTTSWYRTANILGYRTAEWPERRRPPIDGVSAVQKPVGTNCDCLPFVHRLGRYGKWQKGVLSHEAYYETLAGLNVEQS